MEKIEYSREEKKKALEEFINRYMEDLAKE